ncbi:MAG TPA: glycosyltransferase family 4 protein [Herpetosiphonaceae bacterium]|nr:glycosyltransferase family 4 protein [Herpetosiphonaceae bacterium]
MAQKIAFIRKGKWPLANVSTAKTLQAHFPEYEVEEIDLIPLMRRDTKLIAANALPMVLEYGSDMMLRRRGVKEAFLITSHMFKTIKRMVAERLNTHEYVFSFQMQSLFDASLPGLPHFVYTDHTVLANKQYPGFSPRQLYNPAWMKLEPSIYHNARLVFTRSTNVARSMVDDYGCDPDRVKCVYAGSNTPITPQPPSDERYGSQNILYIGIDWERKGGPELVAAFALLRAKYPRATLTIVGAVPPISEPGVEVIGRVPVEELPQYYQKAAIFCLPTKLEPFGIVLVEAMAYRLPIVSTTIGAVPDMVVHGENGLLVEPGTVYELAAELDRLLGDPELGRQYGQRSAELAARYNWDEVGQRIRDEILQVLDAPPI